MKQCYHITQNGVPAQAGFPNQAGMHEMAAANAAFAPSQQWGVAMIPHADDFDCQAILQEDIAQWTALSTYGPLPGDYSYLGRLGFYAQER